MRTKYPKLYAARHVLIAVVEVALVLLGAKLLLAQFVPDIELPDIDLPNLPFPDFTISLPDLTMPGWVTGVTAVGKYCFPILVAVGVAVYEIRRRKGGEGNQTDAND